MHLIDYIIIVGYLIVVLGVGVYFLRRQSSVDEYFVGDRKMGAGHIGFSVVATDVGGGFSIGLGGLGFAMGLSGSWLLFSGLVGAWAAAVLVIPKVKTLGDRYKLLSYPDFLEKRFDSKTRFVAAIVSGIGYAGFVGSQILAGGKLCSAVFNLNLYTAVFVMAAVVLIYTSFGGLQAVIYTDTIQWFVLLAGLSLFALPIAYFKLGGWNEISTALPPGHLSLTNISALKFITWMVTIVPIWFVGMTLYQRIYATRDVKTAKRAWYLAGLLEWPLMAFLGVTLGMFARVLFPDVEAEMGLPLLIKSVLPVGIVGLVIAAYFSAIMSTADSCLLASVGNFVNDIYQKHINRDAPDSHVLKVSRALTIVIGLMSISIALWIPKVLDSIMLAYSFMVSGLFVPTIGGLLWKRVSATAALGSMIFGGVTVIVLKISPSHNPLGEPILTALIGATIMLVLGTYLFPNKRDWEERDNLPIKEKNE